MPNEDDWKDTGGCELAHGPARGLYADDAPYSRATARACCRQVVEQATLIGTLVHLWPYIWPGDRVDLKMRVVWSVVLLLIAKVATLAVPFTFKWAIDALTGAIPPRCSRRTGRCG